MLDIFMTAFELYTMMWSNKSFWKHKSEFFDLYLRHNETQQAKFTNGKEYTYQLNRGEEAISNYMLSLQTAFKRQTPSENQTTICIASCIKEPLFFIGRKATVQIFFSGTSSQQHCWLVPIEIVQLLIQKPQKVRAFD